MLAELFLSSILAGLAASGLSNREIGARLYLSHRTVGSDLGAPAGTIGAGSRRPPPGSAVTVRPGRAG